MKFLGYFLDIGFMDLLLIFIFILEKIGFKLLIGRFVLLNVCFNIFLDKFIFNG